MLWSICASVLCLGVCMPLFMYYKKSLNPVLSCSFKALGTACALMLVLVSAIRLDHRCWILVAGMSFHLAADILLEFSFPIGMAFFMAGHIGYIAFLTQLFPVSVPHVICFILLLFFLLMLLRQWKKMGEKKASLFFVYGIILCAMSACAIAGGISSYTLPGFLMAGGGAFFLFSDTFWARRLLFRTPRFVDWLIIATYYIAQLLFGAGCMLLS